MSSVEKAPAQDISLCDGHVRIRPWQPADAPLVLAASDDEEVVRISSVPPDATIEDARRFVYERRQLSSRRPGRVLSLVVVDEATDLAVGEVYLHRFEWPERRAEVGCWMVAAGRGKGLGGRAVDLLSTHALNELGFREIMLYSEVENLASQRIAASAGFAPEGPATSARYDNLGNRLDLLVFRRYAVR